ncbi:MAG: hypothetical protein H6732_03565 [Alphaproteobacteria bacterium]|nr:hypothetical protein [Alphaproteobacteria bacterium]
MRKAVLLVLLAGCEPGEVRPVFDTDDSGGSVCPASVPGLSFTLGGRVLEGATPRQGATVRLEDRSARPVTVFGTATSGADGRFQLQATDVVGWPECWNLLTEHYVVATLDSLEGEVFVNKELSEATRDDEDVIDLTSRPVLLKPAQD